MVGRFSVSLLFLIRVQNLVSLLIQEHTEGTSVTLFKFLSKESSLRFVEFKFLSKESSIYRVLDACGKFGEHKGCVRVAREDSRAS